MAPVGKPLHTSSQRFDLFQRIGNYVVGRYLAARARHHVQKGYSPVAVFAFDFIGRDIALNGRFERDDLAVLDDFLAPFRERFSSSTALDIGANIGNHSLFFANRFAAVHSFEPNPRTFGVLSVNAQLALNISVHNLALGDMRGVLPLKFDPLNVGEATLIAAEDATPSDRCDVIVERLDDLASGLGDVALIKIDVEGFEASVLRGALETLQRSQPIVVFEQNVGAFVNGRSEAAELLQQAGYVLCVLSKRNVGHGTVSQVFGALRKVLDGIQYDIIPVNALQPDHYSMIVALPSADITLLAQRTKTST
jgi:FkbM family methyltransferase